MAFNGELDGKDIGKVVGVVYASNALGAMLNWHDNPFSVDYAEYTLRSIGVECQCYDVLCPVHKGQSSGCAHEGTVQVWRVDMQDGSGMMMCKGCTEDALQSGVFYTSDQDGILN